LAGSDFAYSTAIATHLRSAGAVAVPRDRQPRKLFPRVTDEKPIALGVAFMHPLRPNGLEADQVRGAETTAWSPKNGHGNVLAH